ncbi:bacterio-opsin activator domain-containing protein [Halovenus salina]|uniref:Bacterio-opsin activator domain-containing protein n=1 Tax=Halovenus salina TaxID=1510225 RepID=A0ABD5W1V5_9EURY
MDEGYPGTVFASGEPTIVDDFAVIDNDFEYGDIRSAMYYPVGVHGTITVGSTEPNAFDETDQSILGLLATSAAAACMRAKRTQEIREAREQSDRLLDRVNGLVQNTVEVLVQARTRDELESNVVTELAATEPYSFAWVGQPDVTTEELLPTAWDGDGSLSVDGQRFDLSRENEPVARAYHEGTTQVLTDMTEVYGPLSDVVADSDVGAVVIIPLVYKDATYGVLSVCADDSEVFDEREQVILDALGRAVANAINAVERGRILDATEIIELEFAVDSPDLLFNRLSGPTEGTLEAVGIDYRSDGAVRLYLSAEDVDTEAFIERARTDSVVLEMTTIVDHEDECLVELVVEESLLAVLAEYGAVTKEVIAEDGGARFTVELPAEAEARELFELVESRYPGTDLLGYHERERAVETRQDFKAALSDRLTDRQETALKTAYLGGFFDWPRDIDGNELAEAMDIARPTYHQHLRAAQAKVFEELFE